MGTLSYIADVSSMETRFIRIGVITLCVSSGSSIGQSTSGLILRFSLSFGKLSVVTNRNDFRAIGFVGVFTVAFFLLTIGFFYCFFFVKESPKVSNEVCQDDKKNIFKDFFDFKIILKTVKVTFQKGKDHRLLKTSLMLTASCLYIGTLNGENTLFYLFTRFQFNWSEVEFSYFLGTRTLVQFVGEF